MNRATTRSTLLAVGSYRLAVEQAAFRRYEQTGILLQANENVKIDVKLEVGDVKTAVSVNAAASQIETQVATLKETVDRARVVDLPRNGRDAAQLALLVGGPFTNIPSGRSVAGRAVLVRNGHLGRQLFETEFGAGQPAHTRLGRSSANCGEADFEDYLPDRRYPAGSGTGVSQWVLCATENQVRLLVGDLLATPGVAAWPCDATPSIR